MRSKSYESEQSVTAVDLDCNLNALEISAKNKPLNIYSDPTEVCARRTLRGQMTSDNSSHSKDLAMKCLREPKVVITLVAR